MVRQTRSLLLRFLSFFFSFFLSCTCSRLCFILCTLEANENAPSGKDDVFQMIKPKSYFLGHWTSIEQSQLDTNRVAIAKKSERRSTQKTAKNPLVKNQ